jgi:hypothetical protein
MKNLLVALAVTAGALSIAGGGVGISLPDPHPAFGKTVFVSLEGGGLSKHTGDTITMRCVQNGRTVLDEASTATGYGAYFALGPTSAWAGGAAVCTSSLVKPTKQGGRVLDQFSFAVAG